MTSTCIRFKSKAQRYCQNVVFVLNTKSHFLRCFLQPYFLFPLHPLLPFAILYKSLRFLEGSTIISA